MNTRYAHTSSQHVSTACCKSTTPALRNTRLPSVSLTLNVALIAFQRGHTISSEVPIRSALPLSTLKWLCSR